MKILPIILLATIATHTALAGPDYFTGPYLGGNAGWIQGNKTTSFPIKTVDNHKKNDHLNYGIYIGYGKKVNDFLVGCDVSISQERVNRETEYDLVETASKPSSESSGELHSKYRRGLILGISPRMGVILANENLLYAKLGIEYSKDTAKADYHLTINGVDQSNQFTETSKRQIVFVPGIGFERSFSRFLARIEYGFNFGEKIKTSSANRPLTVGYTAHVVKAGLSYRF